MEQERKETAGIVTFYHGNYNFGGLLQAYALPTAIKEQLGVDAEQLDYLPAGGERRPRQTGGNGPGLYRLVYRLGIAFFRRLNQRRLTQRKRAFTDFMEEIPHSPMTYSHSSIGKSAERYTLFLCGGDQIWNDYGENRNSRVYTLQFAPRWAKKIAYAPSMAVFAMSEEFRDLMKEGLAGLDAISVRERRSLPLLERLTDRPVSVVVDPVLLLTEEQWNGVARPGPVKGRYLLCYLLGDSEVQRRAVKKLAKKLHLPIVTFPHITHNAVRKCDLFFGDIRNYDGPREFLGLIKNAELVVTDSFHACVFSMIFQRPFAVFERNRPGEEGNMNSRIYDFLEEYHLEGQLVTEESLTAMDAIPGADFAFAREHWRKRMQESLAYLEKALKNENNGAKQ